MASLYLQSAGLATIDGGLFAGYSGGPLYSYLVPTGYFISYVFGTTTVNLDGFGDLTVDANGKLTGGNVIGIQEYDSALATSFSLTNILLPYAAYGALLGNSGTVDPAASLLASPSDEQVTLANTTGGPVVTGAGNDTFLISPDTFTTYVSLDGGTGANNVIFASYRSDATVTNQVSGSAPRADAFTVYASGSAYATVQVSAVNVSQLSFIDGNMDSDSRSYGGQVAILFNTLLGHAADSATLGAFAEAMAKYGAAAVANGILAGAEAQLRDGSLTNAAFIAQMYQTALGRAPDAAGGQYWLNQLNNGTVDRGTFAAAIVTSPEEVTYSATTLGINPVFVASPEVIAADRVYQTLTNGLPPAAALVAYSQILLNGGTTAQLAASIVSSTAYMAQYGTPSAASFVNSLQQNVYGATNASVTATFAAQLTAGSVTMAQVADDFASSAAAVAKGNLLATQSGVAHG